MKPLIVLLVVFGLTLLVTRAGTDHWNFIFSGNLAMSVMLLFTAIGHFKFPAGMAMMIPVFIPFKKELVLMTGFIELAASAGLLWPAMRSLTSLWLIVFFICILPANIYAAIKKVDFEKGTNQGPGLSYLWFRIPLQLFFIGWVWYFGIFLP